MLALTGALLAVVPAGSAGAVDPTCIFTTGDVRTFDGSDSNSWADPDNWTPVGIPNDNTTGNSVPETHTTYVCIPTGKTVYLDATELFNVSSGWVHLQGYWLGAGATVEVRKGVALFNNDHATASVIEQTGLLTATSAALGGEGTLKVRGDMSVAAGPDGGSTLMSNHFHQPLPTQAGSLVVEPTGRLLLPNLGVNVQRRYTIQVQGRMLMTGSGFLTPFIETSVTIDPGGTYEFGGVGGFYEGGNDQPPGPDVITLQNNGTLLKTGPGTTSLIGTDYSQGAGAEVLVTGGTLAFAGGSVYSAEVSGGQQLSTAQCAPGDPTQPCVEDKDPTRDPQSVAFKVPTLDPDGAPVQVEELDVEATTLDPDGVGKVFLAHADPGELDATGSDPAVIEFRLGVNVTGTANLAELGIVHVPDVGPAEKLPTCLSSGLPPSGTGCVDRRGLAGSSRIVDNNVILVVRTTATSRYVCHKIDELLPPPPPAPDVKPPSILRTTAPPVGLNKPISVTVKMDEVGTVSVSGAVIAKGKVVLLKNVSVSTNANGEATAVLKLTKKQKKKLKQTGAKRGTAVLTVSTKDAAGNVGKPMSVTVNLT